METRIERHEGAVVIEVPEDGLKIAAFDEFRLIVFDEIKRCPNLVLDMMRISFFASSGIGGVLLFMKRCRELGGDVKLCNASDSIRLVLKTMRLDSTLEVLPTREAAVRAFQTAPTSPSDDSGTQGSVN
ncbi:STAS domain protein [Planctomycetes bacterium Pan216]|uniref:STAS domain protein n=1 Tax=Kolteria novifilia TaxID=2527975 RepID=A0A518B943_9BACT|nr:STAS domain protein [Planctomycetes bacterium Pan216]